MRNKKRSFVVKARAVPPPMPPSDDTPPEASEPSLERPPVRSDKWAGWFLTACVVLCVVALILVPWYWIEHYEGSLPFPPDEETKVPDTPPSVIKQGLMTDEDGEIRYYVNNTPFYAGLVRDVDGDYYYISSVAMTAVRNVTRYISYTNGLLPEGTYTFGADGKICWGTAPDTTVPTPDTTVSLPDTIAPTPDTTQPHPSEPPVVMPRLTVTMADTTVTLVTPEVQAYLASDIRDDKHVELRPTDWTNPTIRFDTQMLTSLSLFLENGVALCYKIEWADNEGMERAVVDYLPADATTYMLEHLYANTIYYYRVTAYTAEDGAICATGSFRTADTPRILSVPGLYQVRDIGNWPTDSGKRIRQGLLLRGTEMDAAGEKHYYLTVEGLDDMLNTFGIRSDLDLRSPLIGGKDALGATVMHKYYDMVMYEGIFTYEGMLKIRKIFSDLADPSIYPVYLHCTYGCDRTGMVCYLLEALLGVSPDDCLREYGLSNLPLKHILTVEEGLARYEGDSLKEQVESYLRQCGVTAEEIASIRTIFLGE